MPSPMSRNFVITVFPEYENEDSVPQLNPEDWDKCRYFIWQLEMAPSTGKYHYQAYLETTAAVRFSAIQKWEGMEKAHIEKRKGSPGQAIHYCKKPVEGCNCDKCEKERTVPTKVDGPWEFGDHVEQGNRTDLDIIHAMCKSNQPLKDIIEYSPSNFIRYHTGISKLRSIYAVPRDFKSRVYFIFGPTGCGKSSMARELVGPTAKWKQPSTIWWPSDYDGTEDVVIDEFKGWMRYSDLLRAMDQFPLQVETKGGQVNFAPKNLVITSNVIPTAWYKAETHFSWKEWARRVDVWLVADGEFSFTESSMEEFYKVYVEEEYFVHRNK